MSVAVRHVILLTVWLLVVSCSEEGATVYVLGYDVRGDHTSASHARGPGRSDGIVLDLAREGLPTDATTGPEIGQWDSQDSENLPDSKPNGGDFQPGDDSSTSDSSQLPFEPFARCSTTQKCPFPQEPLCLLLPDSDEGICVKQCGKGGEKCPPWLECVAVDPNDIGFAVCLKVAELNEKCSNAKGTTCRSGLYCVTPPGEEWGRCTSFCVPGETICQAGTECKSVDPDTPQSDWGACLPMDDLPQCETAAECGDGKVCVSLVAGDPRCLSECEIPGTPCGTFGTCTELDVPGGGIANACVVYQPEGEVCKPSIGLVCKPGLWCTDVSAPDGFFRCLAPCPDGQCPSGTVCFPVPGAVEPLCVPLQFALDDPPGCNDQYPCPNPEQVCVPVPGQTAGVCVPSCGQGCPAGTTCYSGACIVQSPYGGSCLEEKGVYCKPGSVCIRDPGELGPGWCAPECPGGQGCGAGLTCQSVTNGKKVCLEPAMEGHLCSWDDGVGCAGEDTACIHLSSQHDYGFCSPPCNGPGTCPEGFLPDTFMECMIQKGGTWYCAFLCGATGFNCPEWMHCTGMNMCVP